MRVAVASVAISSALPVTVVTAVAFTLVVYSPIVNKSLAAADPAATVVATDPDKVIVARELMAVAISAAEPVIVPTAAAETLTDVALSIAVNAVAATLAVVTVTVYAWVPDNVAKVDAS